MRSNDEARPLHRHLEPTRAAGYAVLPAASPGDVFFDLEGDLVPLRQGPGPVVVEVVLGGERR